MTIIWNLNFSDFIPLQILHLRTENGVSKEKKAINIFCFFFKNDLESSERRALA